MTVKFESARQTIIDMLTNDDKGYTVEAIRTHYPALDLNDVPSPQMIRRILETLPRGCAWKDSAGRWHAQARGGATTREIQEVLDVLIERQFIEPGIPAILNDELETELRRALCINPRNAQLLRALDYAEGYAFEWANVYGRNALLVTKHQAAKAAHAVLYKHIVAV